MALELPQDSELDWDVKLNQALSALDTRLSVIEGYFTAGLLTDVEDLQEDVATIQAAQTALQTTVNGKLDRAGAGTARWWPPAASLPATNVSQEGDMIILNEPA